MPKQRRGPKGKSLGAFLLSLVIVVVGVMATVDVHAATLFGLEGPVCLLGDLGRGGACPSCGLTRSTSLILQGHFSEALDLNPVGLLVVLFAVLGVALGLLSFVSDRAEALLRSISKRAGSIFLVALLSTWLARLLS